jgi:cobalt-zinc-cadmium efflux system outer membrane protein
MTSCLAQQLLAQQSLTWEQVREKFRTANPTLRAAEINVDELRATEITAFFRPNPSFAISADQLQPFPESGLYRPLSSLLQTYSFTYLREREHKRELRLESAQKGTAIAESQQEDLERTMMFTLRSTFIQTLQGKAILAFAKENLDYYDRFLSVGAERLRAGDMAQVDLDRLELQRVQYESDYQTSFVNLRTAKIQLLGLLNDRTPVDQFDVTGPFDFSELEMPQEELRRIAIDTRPDLRGAIQAVDKAQTDHQLAISNGSTDPVLGADYGNNPQNTSPPLTHYVGLNVAIPLRIFDRNQGEKLRTQRDISRSEQLRDAARTQVFTDVDSAYATVISNVNLLKPYKAKYLEQALRVRDTITFSFQNGGASLLDFLNAQNDYRAVRRSYFTLVGSYLTAVAQLNMAVGREVIP